MCTAHTHVTHVTHMFVWVWLWVGGCTCAHAPQERLAAAEDRVAALQEDNYRAAAALRGRPPTLSSQAASALVSATAAAGQQWLADAS